MNENEIVQIDPKSIIRPPQVRTQFSDGFKADLMKSIQSVGILQPVLLRREGTKLIALDGDQRIQAAIELALPAVPALIVDQPLDAAAVLQRQLIANCVRDDLAVMDQARAIQQLMNERGCTAGEAADQIGKSPATVSKLLAILSGPAEVQEKISSGEIGLKKGYQLTRRVAPATVEKPTHRFQKLTVVLDSLRSIVLHGIDSTLDAFISVLEELLLRAKAARKQGIELPTFLAMLRDQAKA
ncbi:MAG: ParB/RepB/Spo0J family partition protein [Burkholderiales bacterium]|nr:ParB/RepB/Spo0J family partition protein [Phycisphaerae bacterium]